MRPRGHWAIVWVTAVETGQVRGVRVWKSSLQSGEESNISISVYAKQTCFLIRPSIS